MIKYEIKRGKKSVGNFIMAGYDKKTIKKSELDKHLSEGWTLTRKKYFIVTDFSDYWKRLSDGNRIALIAGVVVPICIAIFIKNINYIVVSPKFKPESGETISDSLKTDFNSERLSDSLDFKLDDPESKLDLKAKKDIENILLENSVQKSFSNSKTKDNFKITITGNSLLDGKMTFQITDINGNYILKEEFPSYYLIGYELYDDEPKEKQREYIKKRVTEFFNNDNFFYPAISVKEHYDEDYSDLKEWNDIKSDSTSIGFYYLIGEEGGNRIAFSKKENKVVIYFSCC